MRRFQTNLVEQDVRGAAVAIGNFDGVHLGHQAVIDVARTAAARSGAPLGVLTFEPHPRSFFAKKNGSNLPPAILGFTDANILNPLLAKL